MKIYQNEQPDAGDGSDIAGIVAVLAGVLFLALWLIGLALELNKLEN